MNDPYSILGVSSRATDEDIKKAYRELARKYHPDNYHENPLSDLAQEKMKEINEAYNTIMRNRSSGGSSQSGAARASAYGSAAGSGYSYNSGYSSGSASSFEGSRIRAAINAGNIRLAEELLGSFPARNAEWNFLMGSVCYRKGWLNDALTYFRTAVNMEPSNSEYRQALNLMSTGGATHRPNGRWQQRRYPLQRFPSCNLCTAMMCMNVFCRFCYC